MGGGEEVNTRQVALQIGSELKRYSIPQAVFAQQVLCRSQGTLSDLLRNPKPWSKLKSGRETFRRMWKWLQEPEYQRMSTLRLAGRLNGLYIFRQLGYSLNNYLFVATDESSCSLHSFN
jgi:nuclear factor 6 (one cut domain family protein 1)